MPAATVLAGLAAGVGGIAMTLLLHAVQHLAFGYTEDTFLIGVERAPDVRRVLALTLGGLLMGMGWWWHRRYVDAEAVSVTRALRDSGSRLPIPATVTDAALQVIAVGAGASLGREGAPRQAGAALAGWVATRLGVSPAQRPTLLACGAGAGLAAVYNVPFGGAVFTLEIMLASLALRDVITALVVAVVATVVAWPVLSNRPTYQISGVHYANPVLVCALILGPLCGVLGVGFVRMMSIARTHAPTGRRAAAAITVTFAGLGAAAIAYPQLLGNGKGPAQLAFAGSMSLALATALVILKPLATAACLGAGAFGGLLTPALATGAVFGVAAGRLWGHVWSGAPVADYAIVAAAALLAVTQRAPLTAIVLTPEFLHAGQTLVVPIVVAVGLGMLTAWLLDRNMTPIGLPTLHRYRFDSPGAAAQRRKSPFTGRAIRSQLVDARGGSRPGRGRVA